MKGAEERSRRGIGTPGHGWGSAAAGGTFSLHKQALPLGFSFKVEWRGGDCSEDEPRRKSELSQ